MNERELDLALDRLGVEHVRRTAPSALRDRVHAVPLTTKRRSWLPPLGDRGPQPLLNATRFVVAGAIVALFGGFLLAGVLTLPSDDMAPAAVTASPSPTTTEELLSGMVTEEVEPGVFQVLDDGAGHDLVADPPADLTIAPDGEVVLFGAPRSGDLYPAGVDTVYVLGHDAAADVPFAGPADSLLMWFEAAVDHEGSLWAKPGATCCGYDDRLRRYDGLVGPVDDDGWTRPTWPDGSDGVSSIEVTPDGAVWLAQNTTGPGPKVARIEDGEWTVLSAPEDGLPVGEYQGLETNFAAAPDGTAWLSTGSDSAPVPGVPGLLHFDGERWVPVELPIDPRFAFVGPIGLGPDGTLWVYAAPGISRSGGTTGVARLLRLRDGEWTVFEDVPGLTGRQRFGARFEVDADGTLWIAFQGPPIIRLPAALDPARPRSSAPGVLAFDGSTWRQYLDGQVVNRVAVAPDGSVWATGQDGLYALTGD